MRKSLSFATGPKYFLSPADRPPPEIPGLQGRISPVFLIGIAFCPVHEEYHIPGLKSRRFRISIKCGKPFVILHLAEWPELFRGSEPTKYRIREFQKQERQRS